MKKLKFIIFLTSFFLNSCNTLKGHNGVSDSISDSKNRGVFICEYTIPKNPFQIGDSIIIDVKEAWLEFNWKYAANTSESIIYDEFQLCINVDQQSNLEGLGFNWSIGIDFERNMRSSSFTSLISDFKSLPPDTIEYKIQKGRELSDNYEKVIIGKFILIKKIK